VVNYEGKVTWIPPSIMKSTCKLDLTYYPFDQQICDLKFGSWTYNGHKLDLKLNNDRGDTSTFVLNGEWMLLSIIN